MSAYPERPKTVQPLSDNLALTVMDSPFFAVDDALPQLSLTPLRGGPPGSGPARGSGGPGPGDGAAPYELVQGDAVAFLKTLRDGSVDLVVTDPAYESLEKHRAIGTTTRLRRSRASSNDWFPIFPNSRFSELFEELYRVLKKDRHFYLFSDQETMFVVKPLAEAAGFKFWKPLVWDKRRIGMGYHYRSRYEFVLFFEKGKRRLSDLSIPDVIECPRVLRGYPTEKPVAVSEIFVQQSSRPGDLVVDPFMGSASVGEGALRRSRRFLGCDISGSALRVAAARLQGLRATRDSTLHRAVLR